MSRGVQVNLWGLDAIKTKGESVAIVLYLVGARPLREATGRVARYELIPLQARPFCLQANCCTQERLSHSLTLIVLSVPAMSLYCQYLSFCGDAVGLHGFNGFACFFGL